MKKKSKIVIPLILLLLVALVVCANIWRRQSAVRQVRVEIDYCGADTLVHADRVEAYIQKKMPDLAKQQLQDIDLHRIDSLIDSTPFLHHTQTSATIGGSIVVYALQRRPLVHVCAQGEEYYLDDHCGRMPLSQHGFANVIIANGSISNKPNSKSQKQVWQLASYLDSHPDLAPLFDQIYRDSKGDLFLTPKLGNHVVQVGNTDNLDEKFSNLMAFYSRGLSQTGWDTYRQVSVKYREQVVCTKR